MKYIFTLLIVFTMKLTLACTPGMSGGPNGDPYCMGPIFEQQRLIQQQQQRYYNNNYNSGGGVYVKPKAWGAVVMDPNLGSVATSGGKMSEEEAIKAAQSKCDGDCKAIFTYTNGYVAVVGGKVRGENYYSAYPRAAPTDYVAKRKAFKDCEAEANGCELVMTDKSFF